MDIWEDSGLNIVAFGAEFFTSSFKSCTSFNTRFYVTKDLVELLRINLKYLKGPKQGITFSALIYL